MARESLLDRLCESCGIELDYTDIWGRRHAVSDAAKRSLLRAMNIDLEHADPALALEQIESRGWRRILQPVQVLAENQGAAQAELCIPVEQAGTALRWRLTLESGAVIDGQCLPEQLALLEQREIGGAPHARYALPLPAGLVAGYHLLEIEPAAAQPGRAAMRLIVAPENCYLPPALEAERKTWGPAVQMYALRSQRNWGIGDFSDLKKAVELAAQAGAGMVGSSPLHALFPCNPSRDSPYSPSSRNFLNVLYLDVEAIADFAECAAAVEMVRTPRFQAQLRELRAAELVDYQQAGALKLTVVELLYRHFRRFHLESGTDRALDFRKFQATGAAALRHQALFEALQEHFARGASSIRGWPGWPDAYHDPDSAAVASFAAGNQTRIEFYMYLQWSAQTQLAAVAHAAQQCGMALGLYRDLAVGVAADGAEAWAGTALYARGAYIGAPPDEFNRLGQDWGLPPPIPHCLRDAAYAPFITTLRANMRCAGALRLDHVMGLMRLFWVPAGAAPTEGAYVHYPLADLIGIVALESRRNRCMVIGEDLGTVAPQVRAALDRRAILSCRLFYFESAPDGAPAAPAAYPRNALVAVGTHDLPTLGGFWNGHDLDLRATLGLYPSDAARTAHAEERAQQRSRILQTLEQAQLMPAAADPDHYRSMSAELVLAIHRYLARTPARIMSVQMEDVFGQLQQVNLPGSGEAYPNWRRKLPCDLEAWAGEPRWQALAQALSETRGGVAITIVPAVPRATYRLQFGPTFTFADAEKLAPYLDALGISHCYASPYFKARPGSTHGYDIIDHDVLNPEIGGQVEFESYVGALRRHGMGQILDIVPNHMAVMGSDNDWWLDLLENGQASRYADFFDIDWQPQNEELRDKVLVPVLCDQYGKMLEQGSLQLRFDRKRGEFSIWYEEHRFPVDPREYPDIIGSRWPLLAQELGAGHPQVVALQSLADAFSRLPPHTASAAAQKLQRERDQAAHKRRLATLCANCIEIDQYIEDNVALFNGDPHDPDSFDLLHRVIQLQAYRLGHWRVASDEINYRHFADVVNLAGLRIEDDEVFSATHRLVAQLVGAGQVDGLRIDHPDGLFDPLQYFLRLRQLRRPPAGEHAKLYIVIEKILAEHEHLPSHWPVDGTTGYRFANLVNGLFVDGANAARMDRAYAAFTGELNDFERILHDGKKSIMQGALASALNVLVNRLSRIAQMDRHTCDFTANSLRHALTEIAACFPVYRTYITAAGVAAEDRHAIEWAAAAAKKRSRVADISIYDFVRDTLLTTLIQGKDETYRAAVIEFAMKFQQFSSPVMAKGMEDTGFYIYHRLTSLNEVGGDPRSFGFSLKAFHAAGIDRAKHWPHTMLSTSTHDSKRSEDVRARINVLSELPALWRLRLRHWSRINRSKKTALEGGSAPSRNDEYLLYQTLIGCWPLEPFEPAPAARFGERIEAYMLKAVREAKQMSSWINPNLEYENALSKFIKALLAPSERNLFLADFLPFQQLVSRLGMFNSLSQTLIKLTSPGVPDIYQGNELWNFSLVDPDNRRPVDFECRRGLLAELKHGFGDDTDRAGAAAQLLTTMDDGRIKLFLTWKVLEQRRRFDRLFRDGDYLPLAVRGLLHEHVCAFARRYGEQAMVVAAPRLFYPLAGPDNRVPVGPDVWGDTIIELPENPAGTPWINPFTGATLGPDTRDVSASDLFAHFPYALLLAG